MKLIPLTKGKFAVVDDDLFNEISKHKWCLSGNGYAMRHKNGTQVLLHREIMQTPSGMDTDHINGDKLDNRLSNLRICTHAQNMKNMKAYRTNSLGFKGVYRKRKKFRAEIQSNGKRYSLGTFSTPDEASNAYRMACLQHHGEYAKV